jgi:hypothetical protein
VIVRQAHIDAWWDLGGYQPPQPVTLTGQIGAVTEGKPAQVVEARPIGFRMPEPQRPRTKRRVRRVRKAGR